MWYLECVDIVLTTGASYIFRMLLQTLFFELSVMSHQIPPTVEYLLPLATLKPENIHFVAADITAGSG